MKKVLYSFFAVMIMSITVSFAQTQKAVYVNMDSIKVAMPEFKNSQKRLEVYKKQFQGRIDVKVKEFQQKQQNLQVQQQSMTPQQLQEEIGGLQALEQEIYQLQQEAQLQVLKKEQELLKPIKEKMDASIKTVAEAEGIDVVLPSTILLYGSDVEDYTQKIIDKMLN
ncbi:OmpH family outer membrane protein [Sediminitomix flava]|uniref:Periplasmic chaperone for outer membrane proteins Skp n=1 Tax=Sediminitomix flava TaxID=379075 RepID=A0A315ZGW9_SEDFL|nr:OmpH family outer membrane protein [Sediminitomix flava]PWJ44413.1 periplasmic chaperone for outer membrane proteins Skp [Sediminitomix flava]